MNDSLPDPVSVPEGPRMGLAVASLILGVVSVAYSLFLVGGLLAIAGLVLGVAHLRKRAPFRALAIWGVCLSLVGLLATAWFGYLGWKIFTGVKQFQAAQREAGGRGALSEWEGRAAPDFSVTDLEGKTHRLSELRGKRVVLDFWATWCPPCRKEIPHFIELVNDPGAGDLVVIGISRESEETLAAFAQEQGINYPVASAEDLPAPFGEVRSIPTTFFVDRNGVIQTVFEGYRDFQTLKDAALAEDFKGEAADLPVLDAPEIDPAPAASGAGAESPPAAGP